MQADSLGISSGTERPHDRALDRPGTMPWSIPGGRRRQRRGRTSNAAGRAAEEVVLRSYLQQGYTLLEERWRSAWGEIDLVVSGSGLLVFVEVKQRKHLNGWDSPVTARQWHRLEAAANQYISGYRDETGVQPICRFDVALVGHDGVAQIIENAWSCPM